MEDPHTHTHTPTHTNTEKQADGEAKKACGDLNKEDT